jgi:SHS2 domain-containing protein
MASSTRGHRVVPHTADMRVKAWAPTREECIAEAVAGTVASFVDTSTASSQRARTRTLERDGDEDLLVAVLEEVVYLLDTTGEVPVAVDVEPGERGVEVRFGMVPVDDLPQVGAVPKAVSLHELLLQESAGGWECSVTLDV